MAKATGRCKGDDVPEPRQEYIAEPEFHAQAIICSFSGWQQPKAKAIAEGGGDSSVQRQHPRTKALDHDKGNIPGRSQ